MPPAARMWFCVLLLFAQFVESSQVETTGASHLISSQANCINIMGNWSGSSAFFSFSANSSTPLGNKPDMWVQENILSIEEQYGCFLRGSQFYKQPDGSLFFVSNVFGVIEDMGVVPRPIIRIRLQEYYNVSPVDTDETLGLLDIVIYSKELTTMYITYTGVSKIENRFGAQTFVARKSL